MYLQEHLIPITLGGEISWLSPLTVFLCSQWNVEVHELNSFQMKVIWEMCSRTAFNGPQPLANPMRLKKNAEVRQIRTLTSGIFWDMWLYNFTLLKLFFLCSIYL